MESGGTSATDLAKMLSGDFSSLNLANVEYGNIPAVGFKIVEGSSPESESESMKVYNYPANEGKMHEWTDSWLKHTVNSDLWAILSKNESVGESTIIVEPSSTESVGESIKIMEPSSTQSVGETMKVDNQDTSTEWDCESITESEKAIFDEIFLKAERDSDAYKASESKSIEFSTLSKSVEASSMKVDNQVSQPESDGIPLPVPKEDFPESDGTIAAWYKHLPKESEFGFPLSFIKRIVRNTGFWLNWLWRPLTSTKNEIREAEVKTVHTNSRPANRNHERRKMYEYTDSELENMIDEEDVPEDKETYDKLRAYLKQLEESEGFDIDVDEFPGYLFGLTPFVPYRVSREHCPKDYEIFEDLAKFALESFNFYQKTKFEVVEVEKVNITMNNYFVYNITFTATDVKKSWRLDQHVASKTTFQARVSAFMLDRKRPKTLDLCRIRPDS